MSQVSLAPFAEHLEAIRAEVDAALDHYSQFDADSPARLSEAIRYSLLSPGKRLRPVLVLLAAEACGSSRTPAMPAACAVEMIHAYSLIHDDLPAMDDDDLRRGRPSCHKQFDEATAILAGDALLAHAFRVLATELEPAHAGTCCAELSYAAGPSMLVGGQADDLSQQFGDGDVQTLEAIHRRKTGAMIIVALRLGAIISGATAEQLTQLTTYGEKIGLAFQVVDDLLDAAGNEAAMGKRVGKDAARGKLTYPGLLGVQESQRKAERLINEARQAISMFGDHASHMDSLAVYILERKH